MTNTHEPIIQENLTRIDKELQEAKERNAEIYYISSIESPSYVTDPERISITKKIAKELEEQGYTILVTGDCMFIKL